MMFFKFSLIVCLLIMCISILPSCFLPGFALEREFVAIMSFDPTRSTSVQSIFWDRVSPSHWSPFLSTWPDCCMIGSWSVESCWRLSLLAWVLCHCQSSNLISFFFLWRGRGKRGQERVRKSFFSSQFQATAAYIDLIVCLHTDKM